jgi:hypothetical protein
MTHSIWDYNYEDLKKSKRGNVLILERLINYGVYLKDNNKIPLDQVKRYWNELKIEPKRKKLFARLIWGK